MAYKKKAARKKPAAKKPVRMAKRKRSAAKKTSTRRRARVGAVRSRGGVDIVGSIVAPIAGAVAAGFLQSTVLKNASPMIRNVAPIGAGVALLVIGKQPALKGLGVGMIVAGGAPLLGGLLPVAAARVGAMLDPGAAVAGQLDPAAAVSGMPAVMKYGMKDAALQSVA